MSEPFLGEIRIFAGNFAPVDWAFCHGQILSIAQNTALFSLLGTAYGGNGQTTFALPDLRGRVPIHFDQGPGLTLRSLGEHGGEESHTLIQTEMPAHTHSVSNQIKASSEVGTSRNPSNRILAGSGGGNIYAAADTADATLASAALQSTINIAGGSQPHNIMQPYLCLNFIISLAGIYPSRS